MKKLELSDLRAQRNYLTNEDYGFAPGNEYVPKGVISEGSWSSMTLLPDTVALMTTDWFTGAIETMQQIAGSWLDIHNKMPDKSPMQAQCLAAYECFEGGIFNAVHGWYRLAGISIRNAIEDILVGLYYQHQPKLRADFDAVTTGNRESPGRVEINAELLKYVPQKLLNEINTLYRLEMSIYVHRMSDGELWEGSNGPVFVGEQMEKWIGQYERAYRLLSQLIQAVVARSDIVVLADAIQFATFKQP